MNREFMMQALDLAREALEAGEVPVGCVIVRDGRVVGKGRNRREECRTALGHAEMDAIAQACETLGSWRLTDCTLYVTLEPCPMCAGAVFNARIPTVVFGAYDGKAGACGSVAHLLSGKFPHKAEVYGGIMEKECTELLQRFFEDKRQNK